MYSRELQAVNYKFNRVGALLSRPRHTQPSRVHPDPARAWTINDVHIHTLTTEQIDLMENMQTLSLYGARPNQYWRLHFPFVVDVYVVTTRTTQTQKQCLVQCKQCLSPLPATVRCSNSVSPPSLALSHLWPTAHH